MKIETQHTYVQKIILSCKAGKHIEAGKREAIAIAAIHNTDVVVHHSMGSYQVRLAHLLNQITKISEDQEAEE